MSFFGSAFRFIVGSAALAVGVATGQPWLAYAGLQFAMAGIASLKTSEGQAQALANVTDPQAPLPIVYGATRLGLRLVDMQVDGSSNKDLYIVGALCHGSQDGSGIQAIYAIYFDGRMAVNAAGTVQSPYVGKLTVTKYLGTDTQNVDTTLAAKFASAWPSTSKGRGVAYIVLKLTYDTDVFPTGIPVVTVDVRGSKLYDPRTSTWAYSTNPILALYDYLTSVRYGLGAASTEMSSSDFNTFATYCETSVTLPDASAQNLFTINGWLDPSVAVADNVQRILSSCRGNLVYEGGTFRPYIRRVVSPTSFTLTEANIIGDWQFTMPGITKVGNSIRATYVDELKNYQADTKVWPRTKAANAYLTADGGFPTVLDVDLPMTANAYMAEQIGMVTLKERRDAIMVAVRATEAALQLQVGDLVPVTHSTGGFSAKLFWVLDIRLLQDATVRLVLGEYESTAYTISQTLYESQPNSSLPNPWTCVAPTSLTATTQVAGTALDRVVQCLLNWTASTDPYLQHYDVQAKQSSDSLWQDYGPIVDVAATSFLVTPLPGQTTVDVRIRAVNSIGVASSWVTLSAIGTTITRMTRVIRIPVADFVPTQATENWKFINGSVWNADFLLGTGWVSVLIPPGVTLTQVDMRYYMDALSINALELEIYRMNGDALTSLALMAHTFTRLAYTTYTQSLSELVASGYHYVLNLRLLVSTNAGSYGVEYVELTYTTPNLSVGY